MDKTTIIKELKEEFAKKRAGAQAVAYSNLSKARENKDYAALEKQERELVFDIAKLKANNQISNQLDAKYKKILAEKQNILTKLGITSDMLTPKYECNICHDVGFTNGGMCNCFKKRLHEEMIKQSGLQISELADFKNFDPQIATNPNQQKELMELKTVFTKWSDKFPENKAKTVLITGATGVGKTFLSQCIAKQIIDKGYLVSFVTAFGMNNILLKYHTTFNSEKDSYLDMLFDPDVLIIDDLGSEPILRNITIEYLYLILSERVRKNKSTIITTNLDLNDILARYGERVFSRIVNKQSSLITKIQGDDLRLIKK